ncbi:acyltransferase family protein [Lactiplantibacillus pingfangensis]|uniref:acyltransferase family protein n=1 Tax=Lactiplantibacillus pingfangensis TaxID=2559915 RepID=UPI0010F6D6B2|nr:acyltransferase family protein [Lactiplantibacillus pingfangensis]
MKRIRWIDTVRGIAILAVIVGHSLQQTDNGLLNQYIYAVHMPIFFILSGYLYREKGYKREFTNGLKNLVVPYAFTALMVIILGLLTPYSFHILKAQFPDFQSAIKGSLYGAGDVGKYAFFQNIQPIGAIWFLLAMFLAIQIFNVLMRITKDVYHREFVRFVFFSTCGVVGFEIGQVYLLPWSLNAAFLVQVFLYMGYLMKKWRLPYKISWLLLLISFGLWTVSASQGFLSVVTTRSPNMLVSIVGAFGGAVCLIQFGKWLSRFKKMGSFLQKCGHYSIIIFCFHLIDLDAFNVGGVLAARMNNSVGPNVAAIIVIVYHLIIPLMAMYTIKWVPIVRSIYLSREYPFLKRSIDNSK